VHGNIIDVCADTIADRIVIASSFGRLTEVLLFIANKVFSAGNDTSALDALHGLSELDTGQDRIRTARAC